MTARSEMPAPSGLPAWLEGLLAETRPPGPEALRRCEAWAHGLARECAGVDAWGALASRHDQACGSARQEAGKAADLLRRRAAQGLARLGSLLLEQGLDRATDGAADGAAEGGKATATGLRLLDLALDLDPGGLGLSAARPLPEALAAMPARLPLAGLPARVQAALALAALERQDIDACLEHLQAIPDGSSLPLALAAPLGVKLAAQGLRDQGGRVAAMTGVDPARAALLPPQRAMEALYALLQTESFPQAKALFAAMDPERLSCPDHRGGYLAHLVRFGRPEQAVAMAGQMAAQPKPWGGLHLYHCFALLMLGRHDEALDALSRDGVLNGMRDQTFLYRGLALWEAGRSGEALAALEEGLAHPSCAHPQSQAVLHHQLGLVLRGQGRLEEALERLRLAAELYPENWRMWFDLALGLEQAGCADEALEAAARGGRSGQLVNNLCPLLEQALRSGGLLDEAGARRCLFHAEHYMAPWLPVRLWAMAMAAASLHALGLERERAEAARLFQAWPPAPDAGERAELCRAMAEGRAFGDAALAERLARSLRPAHPKDGPDRRWLERLFSHSRNAPGGAQ